MSTSCSSCCLLRKLFFKSVAINLPKLTIGQLNCVGCMTNLALISTYYYLGYDLNHQYFDFPILQFLNHHLCQMIAIVPWSQVKNVFYMEISNCGLKIDDVTAFLKNCRPRHKLKKDAVFREEFKQYLLDHQTCCGTTFRDVIHSWLN